MCKLRKPTIGIVLGSLLMIPLPLLSQQSADDGVEAWYTLDSEFRQAIIDEILARRGLGSNIDDPDELIGSAEDIREALRVSCDISGACADEASRATLGENLRSLPTYDEQEGLRNAEIIRNMKRGYED